MHALLIDDSKAIRSIIRNILTEMGFEVSEACHGQEALERLKENGSTNLILVDWNMPVMNGIDFIRAVRADSAYDDVSVMMVTTESGMEQLVEALEAGANEYVMKPFTKDVLQEKIHMLGLTQA
jgi:two-component system chemotaxis response regulator CheY